MLSFEWDEKKNETNLRKHGISFEEAQTVFYDENAWLEFDRDHSFHEERFRILGSSALGNILIVVHCIRNEDTIRIISSRKASEKEAKEYRRRAGHG
ncbi:MAG: BrnT family toxin [Lachnospiraceae bacterium]|nr:BrnT family toxin [Lachnospiraceae bacterium]